MLEQRKLKLSFSYIKRVYILFFRILLFAEYQKISENIRKHQKTSENLLILKKKLMISNPLTKRVYVFFFELMPEFHRICTIVSLVRFVPLCVSAPGLTCYETACTEKEKIKCSLSSRILGAWLDKAFRSIWFFRQIAPGFWSASHSASSPRHPAGLVIGI